MCGIAGVFGREDAETVRAMTDALVHRGPDEGLVVSGEGFTLGARRLSIVDVEGGTQPLANEAERVWAAQNGELYGFARMREGLLERGHDLRTRCDTEILPHLYEELGDELLEELDGMFALAVWDGDRRRGLLARDRTGKKPLYYLERDGELWFASELKALLLVPGFERVLDLESMHHYLSFKHVPAPRTIFRGVRSLPPAHRLAWSEGRTGEPVRYWRPRFDAPDQPTEDEAVEQLDALLRAGVERRLMGDVPIGFFLSGGLDSSLSTAIAAELASGPVQTFTLGYAGDSSTPGKEADRRWAGWVAQRYRTDHHEEEVDFGRFPETIGPILRSFDEPFAGVVSTYFLSELIARHVKVAVSGDGADELFGSYRSHRLAAAEPDGDEVARRTELFVLSEAEKRDLYVPAIREALARADSEREVERSFAGLTATGALNRTLESEFLTVFPDQVLAFVDRLSMAHSLEVRTAYLDTAVVELVAGLPGAMKIRDGRTKHLLKRVAARYFPAEMIDRPKEGFVMPVTDWLLADLEVYVRETLAPERVARVGIFDPVPVSALVNGFYREGGDWRYGNKILALVVFHEWFDIYRPQVP